MSTPAEYHARRRADIVKRYNLILELMQTPMTLKQLALVMPFKNKRYHQEVTVLADYGYLVIAGKDLKGQGQKKSYLYQTSKMPFIDVAMEKPKAKSTIHRLTDKVRWASNLNKDRVYVSGETLSAL